MTMATPRTPLGPVSVRRLIPASPAALFSFLCDLENQCLLAHDHTTPLRFDGPPGARHGAALRVRGPLGLRRKARARIVASAEPSQVIVGVELRRTVVRLRWTLTPLPASTRVELTADIARAGILD